MKKTITFEDFLFFCSKKQNYKCANSEVYIHSPKKIYFFFLKILTGKVEKGTEREDGQFIIKMEGESDLFKNIPKETPVLLTHRDSVLDPGQGYFVKFYFFFVIY